MKAEKKFTPDDFRKELLAVLPGHKWTVHKPPMPWMDKPEDKHRIMEATGIVSAGFNRMSTICVHRSVKGGITWYTVKSWGYGTHGRLLGEQGNKTLKSALRDLQDHFDYRAREYRGAALDIEHSRPKKVTVTP